MVEHPAEVATPESFEEIAQRLLRNEIAVADIDPEDLRAVAYFLERHAPDEREPCTLLERLNHAECFELVCLEIAARAHAAAEEAIRVEGEAAAKAEMAASDRVDLEELLEPK